MNCEHKFTSLSEARVTELPIGTSRARRLTGVSTDPSCCALPLALLLPNALHPNGISKKRV